MKNREKQLAEFRDQLFREEMSCGTVEKYTRDVRRFAVWLETQSTFTGLSKEAAASWKQSLLDQNYSPVTINSMISALNRFFVYVNREDCRLRFLKIQRRSFRSGDRNMTKKDYERLVSTAERTGRRRLALVMETICSTGIRVSEVKYLTVEAVREGRAEIAMKGKIRTILLPSRLRAKLLKYAKQQNIRTGAVFITSGGRAVGRKQIWAEMKRLCRTAGVNKERVYPHNLRHLFARTFYRVSRDLSKLADLLGHSSIDTTRIYLQTTEKEQMRQLEHLGLVV